MSKPLTAPAGSSSPAADKAEAAVVAGAAEARPHVLRAVSPASSPTAATRPAAAHPAAVVASAPLPPLHGPAGAAAVAGSCYSALQFADGKLALRASQKLWLGDTTALFGLFTDGSPSPVLRVQAKTKLFVPPLALRVSARARLNVTSGATKTTLYLKQRLPLGGHTALNGKVELHAHTRAPGLAFAGTDVQARLELSYKALNVTTTQDARLRVGVDVLDRSFFAEVRENRLSACVEWRGGKPGWSLLYDL